MNNQIRCEIIQDLMPLVLDDACSDFSRQAVEEHVAGCEKCAEVYAAMKSETPKPAADENEKKHFVRAMKKTRRKTWLTIAALCLAAVLLTAGVMTYFFPDYNRMGFAPVEWFHNAQLLRTEEGELLLRFTPDEKYRDYLGTDDGWWLLRYGLNPEDPDCVSLEIGFKYSSAAKLLNRDVPYGIPKNEDLPFMRLGEDWIIPLSIDLQWYAEDGKLVQKAYRPVTEEEREAVMNDEKYREMFEYPDHYASVVKLDADPDMEPIPLEHLQVNITDKPDSSTFLTVFGAAEDIPLCSEEIAELYRTMKKIKGSWGYTEYSLGF